MRTPDSVRFWRSVDKTEGGCWPRRLSKNGSGYGCFGGNDGRRWGAHVFAYVEARGAVPDGLELDHLCRNRARVNPSHLEAVTKSENVRRGTSVFADQAKRTHCPKGHPYDEANTLRYDGLRYCKICRKAQAKKRAHARTKTARGIPFSIVRGEQSSSAKMTAATVAEARRRHAAGEQQRALSREYGISEGTMSLILRRIRWSHVA